MKTVYVTIWICPRCHHYYGSSNAGDLSTSWNYHHNEPTFLRSRCPNPSCAKDNVHRIPKQVEVLI